VNLQESRIVEAAALVESELGPDVAWSLGTITSDAHGISPHGRGVTVHLIGPGTDWHPDNIQVFEKHATSFYAAAERAVGRYKRRSMGDRRA
jgi:hypothetical protein